MEPALRAAARPITDRGKLTMTDHVVTGLGHPYEPPSMNTLDRRLKAADKPGEHLWVLTVAFHVTDPAAIDRGQMTLMDAESIIMYGGPGCYKCERPYSAKMAKRPCLGNADLIMPD